jgi:CRP-like cAMP-binding protein
MMDALAAMPTEIYQKLSGFFELYPERYYGKRQILIFGGEPPKCSYFLTAGQVRMYDITEHGNEIVVAIFRAPTIFPLSWVIANAPNAFYFQAATEVTVREAPPEDVYGFIKDNPDVMMDILTEIYVGVDNLRRRIAHFVGGDARTRLLFGLINETARFGEWQETGSYSVRISESELGTRVGLSRETVSREINKLKRLNLVNVTPKALDVKLDGLRLELGEAF